MALHCVVSLLGEVIAMVLKGLREGLYIRRGLHSSIHLCFLLFSSFICLAMPFIRVITFFCCKRLLPPVVASRHVLSGFLEERQPRISFVVTAYMRSFRNLDFALPLVFILFSSHSLIFRAYSLVSYTQMRAFNRLASPFSAASVRPTTAFLARTTPGT